MDYRPSDFLLFFTGGAVASPDLTTPTLSLDSGSDSGSSSSDHITNNTTPNFTATFDALVAGDSITVQDNGITVLVHPVTGPEAAGTTVALAMPALSGSAAGDTHDIRIKRTSGTDFSAYSASLSPVMVVKTTAVAPSVTSGVDVGSNSGQATLNATANDKGTLYWVVDTGSQPTALQVSQGKDTTGTALGTGLHGSVSISSTGAISPVTASNLLTGTYFLYTVQQDLAGNLSTVTTSSSWSEVSSSGPNLSAATGVKTGYHFGRIGVTTDTVAGTWWWVVVLSSDTAPTAAEIRAGHKSGGAAAPATNGPGGTAVAAATLSANVSGLTAGLTYKHYSTQDDGSGNHSAVASSGTFTTDAAAYSGPGNIVASSNWWGLRAYNQTYAESYGNAIDIVDSGGSNAATITVFPDGTLDSATLSAWISSHGTASVTKVYDQVSTKHFTQATVANMPTINMTGINSKPVMAFNGTSQSLSSTGGVSRAQQYWAAAVASCTNNGAQQNIFCESTPSCQVGADSSGANTWFFWGSTVVKSTTATDGVAHGGLFNFNGASSNVTIDGSTSSNSTVGSNSMSAGTWNLGQSIGGANWWKGTIAEFSLYPSGVDLTSNVTNFYNDQHSYWGV